MAEEEKPTAGDAGDRARKIVWNLPAPSRESADHASGDESQYSAAQLLHEMQELRRTLQKQREEIWELKRSLDHPAIREALAELIRALAELVPKAVSAAKRGKPALLRLIVRAIRLK